MTPNQRLSIVRQIKEIQASRRTMRQRHQNLVAEAKVAKSQPLIQSATPEQLKKNLQKIIPSYLVPGNVGNIDDVLWNFDFNYTFDFGDNPLYNSETRQSRIEQVDQVAGFLLTHISRTAYDSGESGINAPLSLTIRDRQSSRQFVDEPISIQAFGTRGRYTQLLTPLYFPPNANMEIILSSWLGAGESFQTNGSGIHQFMLSGLRIRNANVAKIISSIFL